MKARDVIGTLSVMLGAALAISLAVPPAAAETGGRWQVSQAWSHPHPGSVEGWHGPGPGPAGRRQDGMRRFSPARMLLRHQQELGLTQAQIQTLRQMDTEAERAAIKREADRRLAELDLRALLAPDGADPGRPRDLAKIETQVREIEKLRGDGRIARIRTMEESRQVLTPEQREKLRTFFAEHWQRQEPPRSPRMPGMRGEAPDRDGRPGPAAWDGDDDEG